MKNIIILYEDDFSIVVNKPAGLAVQGGEGVKSSLDRLLAEIRTPPPLLVHRLDKDTSGVILAAKTRQAAADFSTLFGGRFGEESRKSAKDAKAQRGREEERRREVVKQYIAVCAGEPDRKEGIIAEDLEIRGKRKKSETRFKVIRSGLTTLEWSGAAKEEFEYSVLELELGTGRMHQIRRHLAGAGTPVLGDDKYGDFKLNKKLLKSLGLKRLLLHASHLVIKDFNIDVSAPLPDYFLTWCQL